MKEFPSVPSWREKSKVPFGEPCYGFYKYDGSNLRWEWRRKKGFYKHGTRNRLFGADESPWNQAIPLFLGSMAEQIERVVTREHKGIQEFTVYTEFLGPSSFAGNHVLDEPKELKLIDVWIHQKGFIPPNRMVRIFDGMGEGAEPWMPVCLYYGNLNRELIEQVAQGHVISGGKAFKLDEGLMCKGVDRRDQQWMVKIKTIAWIERLKQRYGQDWEKYA